MSQVHLEVWVDRRFTKTKCVAKGSFIAPALLQTGNGKLFPILPAEVTNTLSLCAGPHSLDIIYPRESAGLHCQLYITATAIYQDEENLGVKGQVANLIAQPSSTISRAVTIASTVAQAVQKDTVSAVDIWVPLLEKINLFASVMDQVSEVHPYLSAAWTILDAGRKVSWLPNRSVLLELKPLDKS
ncbi:hypothetical protein FA95DRAFT_888555 [Auriscalpium vulgare]|uniref:Uncharacterized protein n=1 Tax=Auriscalpium vulgare TaxID=40419 RepID=A0ACB8R8T2_9AGAM|nr:hypothetical protein FA95DRAFT_888555 [Auriscalpium vulgare]